VGCDAAAGKANGGGARDSVCRFIAAETLTRARDTEAVYSSGNRIIKITKAREDANSTLHGGYEVVLSA